MRMNLRLVCGAAAAAIATSTAVFAETDAQLIKEAKIPKAQAERTALAKVPKGKIFSEEIERESRKLIWSFDIAKPGTKNITEVQVDATTGAIASIKVETPKDQRAEAAADRGSK